jgi:hypothetical protein
MIPDCGFAFLVLPYVLEPVDELSSRAPGASDLERRMGLTLRGVYVKLPNVKHLSIPHNRPGDSWAPQFIPSGKSKELAHVDWFCVATFRVVAGAGRAAPICCYSITSSARASSVGGTSRPNALAALRLITKLNLIGACTGRSPGFSPLRMRST